MKNKPIVLIVFALIVMVQVYIPVNMIIHKDDVLKTGKEYKFRTRPVDPNDPFRGKFIVLDYEENEVRVNQKGLWRSDEDVYVLLNADSLGYSGIEGLSKVRPTQSTDFVKAKIGHIQSTGNDEIIRIQYPFDRFYMEETSAANAEKVYRNALADSNQVTYAVVKIKDGEAVLKDVCINGSSIKELVKKRKY